MHLFRLIQISIELARHRLDRLLPKEKPLPLWANFILLTFRFFPKPKDSPEVSLRLALEKLGPIFIKLGQILSTRRDLFSDEVINELEKLQDQVAPFSSEVARKIIESEINCSIETVFTNFNNTPLASASIAQIHEAKLMSDEDVVVKVVRPGIGTIIKRDVSLMLFLANCIELFWEEGKRLHALDIVKDYEFTISNELNLQLEAANTSTLRQNWIDSDDLYVPKIYWEHCTSRVMVIERIYGIRSNNLTLLNERGVDLKKLAHLGVNIFFTQVFDHNFFHADMHPGNVFIDISDPKNPSYIALDCAIIGSLSKEDKDYLAQNLVAFFHQDYAEVARLHVVSGWVPENTNIMEFEAVIRSVCAPVFQKPIKDISFGKLLTSLFKTAREFKMEVQPQLILLQKTLLNIEGMGRQIYPELDLWETAAPFMENWMRSRYSGRALLKAFKENIPRWINQLPQVPDLALGALTEINLLGEKANEQARLLTEIKEYLDHEAKKARYTRIGTLALVTAILLSFLLLSGYVTMTEALVGTSLLSSFEVYWLYFQS
ncbi:MAG: 2-polyprenylphenol 6-hydroxylase [Candidatus Azotimanducaceae bacterium]|nr:2-polyprenylphenol 6-hydroxylase [Gammaproteobacteria bacterium]OUV67729.1 MAG: 2-polyprenylphenol 6-hydroxylase [Gammaproteobacteria bacterium TMED133]